MCGIAGLLIGKRASEEALAACARSAIASLRHRGPDDDGFWIDESCGVVLAHTRLSILDLSQFGHQPMISQDGRWALTYNGEIYNYPDLRSDLELRGVAMRGHSDTEVLLEYVAQYGVERALRDTNGMFALALWDRRDRRLFLARDRVGIKPLYFGNWGQGWAFASELKALMSLPNRPNDIDPVALGSFVQFGYVPGQQCIFEGVQKVEPGTFVAIRLDRQHCDRTVFWDARSLHDETRPQGHLPNSDEYIDQLHELLGDAVERRLIADVPVGAFLSGGIDSSLVVALMKERRSANIDTFTIGFDDSHFDETHHASEVARALGVNNHSLVLDPMNALSIFDEIPDLCDEPFADSSIIPTYLVSKFAVGSVKVILSGDGGDELYGGYNHYTKLLAAWRALRRLPAWTGTSIRLASRLLPESSDLRGKADRAAALTTAAGPADYYKNGIASVMSVRDFVPNASEQYNPFSLHASATDAMALQSEMQFADFRTYLVGDILTKVDRATMSVGLEGRTPLLDHTVVQHAWSLPIGHELGNSKQALKQVLKRFVHPTLFERPKSGFSIPIVDWLRGPFQPRAEALIATAGQCPHLRSEAVTKCWRQFVSGRDNAARPVWNILMYLSWKSRWCD